MTTLDLNPETVCFIITKAHEFQAKEQTVIPEDSTSPSDDWARQVLADQEGDVVYSELTNTIEDLEPDQQVTLVALMWLGRGLYDIDDWQMALEEARSSWNKRTAEYLITTPLLADFLEEGLSQHGYSCNVT